MSHLAGDDMRYARPTCDECVRLAAATQTLSLERKAAEDEFLMTRKNDPTYADRKKELDRIQGRLKEAMKREQQHEDTHQDEFSG